MERFTTANRATQRTNTPGVDADPGTLGNVFNNRAGGGVDGIGLSPHSISTQELN